MSLVEWARLNGYRRLGDQFVRGDEGEEISDHDHLPRAILGQYLHWAYHRIVEHLPDNLQLTHHRQRVDDLIALGNNGFGVILDNGTSHHADYVFLATGHGTRKANRSDIEFAQFVEAFTCRNPCLKYFAAAYPMNRLDVIQAGTSVAIQGMGLTAYDVMLTLTMGRGGKFTMRPGGAVYHASGREPRLSLFSRNCLPFAARGKNQKGIAGRHRPRFFTVGAVRALRSRHRTEGAGPQLDFEAEILPLIEKEMAYAYRMATGDCLQGQGVEADFSVSAAERAAISSMLNPLRGRHFASFECFLDFFDQQVRLDLAEAEKGNLASPYKAAADVLRDTRDALRESVEFAGLTPASHRRYVEEFVAVSNRIAFGPPRQRNSQLLALMAAGVLSIAGGPGNVIVPDRERGQFCIVNQWGTQQTQHVADVLVVARVDAFSPLNDGAKLTDNLLRRGLVRPYQNGDYHPGGLDINENMQIIGRNGKPQENFWAIGFPVEGAHFYTHALPRSLLASRFTQDAERCIIQLLQALHRH